ncbi:MAG: hypothetical protein A2176_11830 [Spirochaetes bacterium RBG_13_51_14]|nr:MAG: hypothetical protein A2176_11830 [Spirochaetes bacterium RBG_13_51_14]
MRDSGAAYPGPLRWVVIHLAFAVSGVSFLLLCIQKAGIDIIAIYFHTSYWYYPFLLFAVCVIMIILNIIPVLYWSVKVKKKVLYQEPFQMKIVTGLMAILFCTAALTCLNKCHLLDSRHEPSARELFWARVGPEIRFGPFHKLRADASSGMAVWYFDPVLKQKPAEIRYGPTPIPALMYRTREAFGDGRRHEFHLTGLSPSTRYYYQIPEWGERIYSFHTGPAAGNGEGFRFLCVADTGNTRTGGNSHSYYRDVLQAAAAWYESIGQRPAFMIHAGDMVRTGADLDAWHSHFSSDGQAGSIPGVVTPGNHELLEDGGANFRYFYGQSDYYSLDYGGAHIISIHPFDGPGMSLDGPVLSTGKEQYQWVRDDLARNSGGKWLIAAIHVPILSTGDYGTNEILIKQYFALFRKFKVDCVISGHDHIFDSFHADPDSDWGGTLYIVAGTGGSHLDSYIMDRPERRWLDWFHGRDSAPGRYRYDQPTDNYHVYGELSWGFTDVEIRDDTLTVSYYRWLDFPRFLEITGQEKRSWDMVYFDRDACQKNNLSQVVLVKRIQKKRTVPSD